MPFHGSSLQTYSFSPQDSVPSPARLQVRVAKRRRWLAINEGSYVLGSLILVVYAYAGTIPFHFPLLFLCAGTAVSLVFLALSELHINDRFRDNNLALPQVLVHAAVQFGFAFLAPQIGVAFLGVVLLIAGSGVLRLRPKQAVAAFLIITIATACVFITNLPIGIATATLTERIAGFLAFAAIIGQSMFIGLYGNSLRQELYNSAVKLKVAYSRIEQLADLDELTGALNRRSVMRSLDEEIARAQREGTPCSISLIDLDWFKRINDLYGHPTGDEVLRGFTISMFANIRPSDRFGRYGGEEFLLILPQTDHDLAVSMLNRLRLIVADLDWATQRDSMSVTMSAGVTTLTKDDTAESILARVDEALYAAKHAGRNRVVSH